MHLTILDTFRFGSIVTKWSEINMTTQLLYMLGRFFEFYVNTPNILLRNLNAGGKSQICDRETSLYGI